MRKFLTGEGKHGGRHQKRKKSNCVPLVASPPKNVAASAMPFIIVTEIARRLIGGNKEIGGKQ
jgi:hypothetical protein